MSLEIRIDGVLIENRVRLTGGSQGGVAGFPAAAYYGQIMTAGVRIDDPTGTLDVRGWHVFTADETACSKPRIFTGWITGTKWSRPPEGPNTGPARVIDCDIMDQNALFGFEVFRSTAASIYPAQTDLQRIEQARASHAMAGTPIVDNGRVSASNPVNLTEVNFVARYPGELFTSTAGEAGKQFYAYWDDVEEEISLHYAPLGEGPAASWGVSNVIADVDDDTVFFPMTDGAMSRSPDDVNTGLLFGYAGGRWVYARNQALIDELSPTELSPVNFLRDKVYQTDRVGLTSTANALAQTYLANMATEDEIITFTVRVPAAKVNLAHAGDLIPMRFTHLEGYETETSLPVIRRNVIPSPGRRDMYDITYECSGEATQTGPGGGPGGPLQPTCDVDNVAIIQSHTEVPVADSATTGHITLPSAPTPGNLQWLLIQYDGAGFADATVEPDGYTAVTAAFLRAGATDQDIRGKAFWRIAQSGDTTNLAMTWDSAMGRATYLEFSGVDSIDDFGTVESDADGPGSPDTFPTGTVTPTAGNIILLVAASWVACNTNDIYSGVGSAGLTEDVEAGAAFVFPKVWAGHEIIASASGSYSPDVTWTYSGINRGHAGITIAFTCSGADIPPPHLTVVRNEEVGVGDGTTVTFTTNYPYEPGSLEVYVDLLDQTAAVTAFDPENGSFTLGFAPKVGEVVTVTYLTGAG